MVIHNGTHGDFDVQLYYVRPVAQIAALKNAGFTSIAIYSLDSGKELTAEQADRCADRWLYYLCT